jgi:hypothetical protein
LKPTVTTSGKVNPINDETTKTKREVKDLHPTTRTQDVLSKWTETQFKDNLKDIDGREKENKLINFIFLLLFFVSSANSCSIIKRY